MSTLAQPPEITQSDRQAQVAGALQAAIDGAIRLLEAGQNRHFVADTLRSGKVYAESLRTDGLTMTPCRSCGRLLRESEARLADRLGCCSLCGPGTEEVGND